MNYLRDYEEVLGRVFWTINQFCGFNTSEDFRSDN